MIVFFLKVHPRKCVGELRSRASPGVLGLGQVLGTSARHRHGVILTSIPSPPFSCEYIFKRRRSACGALLAHGPTEGAVQHRESNAKHKVMAWSGLFVTLILIVTIIIVIIIEIITVIIVVITVIITVIIIIVIIAVIIIVIIIAIIIVIITIVITIIIMFGHFWEPLESAPYEGLRHANRTD